MSTLTRTRNWHERHEVMIASIGIVSLVAMLGGVSTLVAANASSTPNIQVTICHATNSQSNPYTTNSINASSIDEEGNRYLNGHGDHTGPVFVEGSSGWGDIIPPFTNPETGNSFPGYNWSEAGQAILANGCAVVVPSPSPTPTETSPSPTPTETSPSPTPTETSPSPTPTETSPSPTPTETSPSPTPTETSPSPTPTLTSPGPTPGESTPAPVAVVPPEESPSAPEPVGTAPEVVEEAPVMPEPIAIAPEYPSVPVVTSVPAGSGPLTLSLVGIGLLVVGAAGLAGSSALYLSSRNAGKS